MKNEDIGLKPEDIGLNPIDVNYKPSFVVPGIEEGIEKSGDDFATKTYSYSQVTTYLSCNRRFFYRYLQDIQDNFAYDYLASTFFDRVVQRAIRRVVYGKNCGGAIETSWFEITGYSQDLTSWKYEKMIESVENAVAFMENIQERKRVAPVIYVDFNRNFSFDISKYGVKNTKISDTIGVTTMSAIEADLPVIINWETGGKVPQIYNDNRVLLAAAHVMAVTNSGKCGAILFSTRYNKAQRIIITKDMADIAVNKIAHKIKEIESKAKSSTCAFKAFPMVSDTKGCKWCDFAKESAYYKQGENEFSLCG